MFEFLVVALLAVIVVRFFAVKHSLTVVARLIAELATNPIRHSVNITADVTDTLDEIARDISSIQTDVSTLASPERDDLM